MWKSRLSSKDFRLRFCEGPLSFGRKKGAPRAPHQRKPGWGKTFFARKPFLSEERKGFLALFPKESRLRVPRPAAQKARRDGAAFMEMQRNRAARPSLRGADGAKRLSSKGVQGGTFFLLKEGFPLVTTPPQSPARSPSPCGTCPGRWGGCSRWCRRRGRRRRRGSGRR